MSRRLLLLNALFLAAAAVAGAYIVRELTMPPARPAVARPRATLAAPPAAEAPPARPAPGAYSVVASHNLFSPTRTEAPPAPAQASRPTTPPVKPSLHGVVLRDGAPIAYLEDPTTKRVAGYRLGDSVAGGTVQAIHSDRVVLERPDGAIDVRLRDPSKPRPPAPPASRPGAPPTPGAAQRPQPGVPTQQPGFQTPGMIPSQRRPLPPNVLRRVPPSSSDAAQQ